MFVGVAICELQIEDSQSLKDKRQVVWSLRDRLRRTFGVSVAEVEINDSHHRAALGIAVVSGSRRKVESMLEKIGLFAEDHASARIMRWSTEVLPFEAGDGDDDETIDMTEEFSDEENT